MPPRRRYNLLSLLCLLQMNAVAHSVANSCRRALTIGRAALYFGTPMGPASVAGVVLPSAAPRVRCRQERGGGGGEGGGADGGGRRRFPLKAVSESVSETMTVPELTR